MQVRMLRGRWEEYVNLAVSSDGKRIVTCSNDISKIWDAETKAEVKCPGIVC